MKEILVDNDLGPLINDSNDSIKRDIEKKDENPFEIITDEEVKSVKKKDNELKKNLMYIMNKDENIYSDLNSVNENNASKETNNIMDELLLNKNTFTDINPLRIQETKDKSKDSSPKSKSQAIKELVSNLKTQYIIFNIRDFIRQYHITANPYINERQHKIVIRIKNICLYFYVIIMFFERPWFCYEGTTIPLPSQFDFIEDCESKIAFSGIPFIYNDLLRVIEIFQIVVIAVTHLIKYKNELILKETNIGMNKIYKIIQIILFISLGLCFIDLIWALIAKKYPIVNFVLRPFLYIYMSRRVRVNWIIILKVVWKTKFIYFLLLINLIAFSCIGYFLFSKEDGYFESLGEAFLQLYILLTTCNFPDIMLDAMQLSKFAIFYFIIYISINIFIILSFLKSLYTNKYYSVNKKDCLKIIKDIFQNSYNKHIFNGKKFNNFILKQKHIYSLTDEEFDNILILFNIYNKNSDIFDELSIMIERNLEDELISYNKLGKYILDSVVVEVVINLLCIGTTCLLVDDKYISLIFHTIVTLLFTYEPFALIYLLGLKRFALHHIKRLIFHIFNFIILTHLFILFYYHSINEETKYLDVFNVFKIFVGLRTIRVFILLDKLQIIQNIYLIVRVSKEMLYRNLAILFSFFFLFSTLSILLTGGTIKKNNFENIEDAIPAAYVNINFNDFGSSYITCFCLMMINNINILVNSLSYNLNHKMFYRLYFATFYFVSTLIMVNIIQTLLLEMYLISDNKPKNEENKIEKDNLNKKIKEKNKDKDKVKASIN